MTNTLSLFDAPPAIQGSDTSSAAAQSMRGKTASIRERVLLALRERPMTDEDLISAMGGGPSTIRPRRVELMKAGLVEKVGEAIGESGRRAAIWGVKS